MLPTGTFRDVSGTGTQSRVPGTRAGPGSRVLDNWVPGLGKSLNFALFLLNMSQVLGKNDLT